MTNAIEREFAPANEAISWAESATDELHAAIQSFFNGDVAEIVTEVDPDTGENVQKLKFKADIPKHFRRKATETLNNARHSFDQTVFAARNILGKRSGKGINYPWARNPTDLDRLLEARGIDARLWDTIRTHEPYCTSDSYPGGDDLIRTLSTIANNKHTIGLAVFGDVAYIDFPDFRTVDSQGAAFLAPIWNPQKNEIELVRWKGGLEMKGNYEFAFGITLKDARLAQPVDAITALRTFTEKAKVVCESVKAKCLELVG